MNEPTNSLYFFIDFITMLLSIFYNYQRLAFAGLLLSVAVSYVLSKLLRTSENDKIPGKLGLPFLGETISFFSASYSTRGHYEFVERRRLRHGHWFKTRLFGKTHVFVPSPKGAKAVLSNDFKLFNKGYFKSSVDGIGKKSVFCVGHEDHKRIRRLLSDPFSMNSLSNFVPKFDKMISERLNKLHRDGKSFTMHEFSLKITFDAMCDMLMTITDPLLLAQIERDITTISDAHLSVPIKIPGFRYYKGCKARGRLLKTFETMIAHRRGSGKDSQPDDFLKSMLERESYAEDEKLDDTEIMDNLLSLLIAGQTTTAAALTWSVKYLDENPQVQDRLREEQLSITEKKEDGALVMQEDLSHMSYASKVAKETLRMSNVLMWYPRVVEQDCSIEGFELKKGWNANVDATCIHFDPSLHEEPLRFNPSRFDVSPKPYSYIPFGAGERTCLGINMATTTMLVFLHRLTGGYKWTVDDQDRSLVPKALIRKLRSGCPITLIALKDAK